MKTEYRLIKSNENGREVYGIETVKRITDVFADEKEGQRIVTLCNELNLSDIHLEDILNDYLLESV